MSLWLSVNLSCTELKLNSAANLGRLSFVTALRVRSHTFLCVDRVMKGHCCCHLTTQEAVAHYRDVLGARMRQEEQIVLPLMRAHFSHQEFKPIEEQMLAATRKLHLAGVVHAMEPAVREAFLKQAGLGWTIQRLSLKIKVMKYDR